MYSKSFAIKNISEIKIISDELVRLSESNNLFLFEGEMGSGKTTLIKEIAKQLGVKGVINSPTFALVNEYEIKNDKIYHFDFYRINKEEEAMDMGSYQIVDEVAQDMTPSLQDLLQTQGQKQQSSPQNRPINNSSTASTSGTQARSRTTTRRRR